MTHEIQESMILRIIGFYCKGYKAEPASEETHRTRSRGSQMPNFLVPSSWNQDASLSQGNCVCLPGSSIKHHCPGFYWGFIAEA